MYEYFSLRNWRFFCCWAIGCHLAVACGLVAAMPVYPSLVPQYSAGATTFDASRSLPVRNAIVPVTNAVVNVGGASRYIPVGARVGMGAVSAVRAASMLNPAVIAGSALLWWLQSKGVNESQDSVGNYLLTKSVGDDTWGFAGFDPGHPYDNQPVGTYTETIEVLQDRAEEQAGLFGSVSWKGCVQRIAPSGRPYQAYCTWIVYQPWDSGTYYGITIVAMPQNRNQQPITIADWPTTMPPTIDIPVTLPVESVSVNPDSAGVSQPFAFQVADSVKQPDNSYQTQKCEVVSLGAPSVAGVLDITCKLVSTAEAMNIGRADTPTDHRISPVIDPALQPGPQTDPLTDSSADGKDGSDGKDGADGKDASPLCDLFPDIAACADLDTVEDGDLATKSVALTLGKWGSWGGAGTCPADVSISHGLSWSYKPLCDALGYLRVVIIAVAWLTSAFIVVGARSGGSD